MNQNQLPTSADLLLSPNVPRANVYQFLLEAWDCECWDGGFWAKERVMKSPTLSYLLGDALKISLVQVYSICKQGSLKAI